jgi:PPOX class probable F420-dependent enzyme
MREIDSLLQAPSPAVLTTYRKDGTAVTSPVWFRFHDNTFEVAMAQDDVKLRHLAARSQCELVVCEVVPPFRGVRVRSDKPMLDRAGAQQVRTEIDARYLGEERGKRFAAERASPGILLRLPWEGAKTWDLTPILPSTPVLGQAVPTRGE